MTRTGDWGLDGRLEEKACGCYITTLRFFRDCHPPLRTWPPEAEHMPDGRGCWDTGMLGYWDAGVLGMRPWEAGWWMDGSTPAHGICLCHPYGLPGRVCDCVTRVIVLPEDEPWTWAFCARWSASHHHVHEHSSEQRTMNSNCGHRQQGTSSRHHAVAVADGLMKGGGRGDGMGRMGWGRKEALWHVRKRALGGMPW